MDMLRDPSHSTLDPKELSCQACSASPFICLAISLPQSLLAGLSIGCREVSTLPLMTCMHLLMSYLLICLSALWKDLLCVPLSCWGVDGTQDPARDQLKTFSLEALTPGGPV